MAGIYIHIPFCKQACSYCDFHFSTNLKIKTAFVEALKKEISLKKAFIATKNIETVYFGGGTPTMLTLAEINQIFDTLDTYYDLSALEEITIEANPDDLSKQYLLDLKNHTPINRLSIGIQSFDDIDLSFMNRAHNAAMAQNALEWSSEAGFDQINADLIFALPWRTDTEYLINNLNLLTQYKPKHISCYQLTIEPQTLLAHQIKLDRWTEHTDKRIIDEFYIVEEYLESQAYIHYEISNYAQENQFAQHNSNYWNRKDYLGLGPSAHSLLDGTRYINVSNNASYIRQMNAGSEFWTKEGLTAENVWNESVLTGLRTIWGVDTKQLLKILPQQEDSLQKTLKTLYQSRQIKDPSEGRIILTNESKILCDRIAIELMV